LLGLGLACILLGRVDGVLGCGVIAVALLHWGPRRRRGRSRSGVRPHPWNAVPRGLLEGKERASGR
jgi:hypothetical protein